MICFLGWMDSKRAIDKMTWQKKTNISLKPDEYKKIFAVAKKENRTVRLEILKRFGIKAWVRVQFVEN